MSTATRTALQGGEFLIRESRPEDIFIPEEFNEEQRMMAEASTEFLAAEVWPNLDRIDRMEEGLMPSILEKAGALGLLGLSIPEQYDGSGKDLVTSMLVTERTGAGHSFSVAMAAHTGIGTLPTLYYGSDAQKRQVPAPSWPRRNGRRATASRSPARAAMRTAGKRRPCQPTMASTTS
jgi:alkylation response protein AidB-like acyl-CoA dehydrogenase